MACTGGAVESWDTIPAHVWKGLPDCLHLGPSVINPSRVGEYNNSNNRFIKMLMCICISMMYNFENNLMQMSETQWDQTVSEKEDDELFTHMERM